MSEQTAEITRIAWSVEQIAKRTSLSKSFLRNEIRAGRLKTTRRGRRVLILNDDLVNYFRDQEEVR